MISLAGHHYGTAAQIAHALGPDITAARVRDWARRSRHTDDRLHGHLPGRGRGVTWYCHDQAVHVEMLTRTTGRGRTRVEAHGVRYAGS
ncbi:hypothetical protein [Salinispora arenicola]|uniref:hypothetical protein n=1 Tax=Salinispora arenicola TaxID=168697 RepID=UPI000487B25C|nr:hypothetical protein [Salinispora arenicola]NIL59955.1 hypothetical protein [Salinispora arenicola]NIL64240.1 hypothetical protein [Salinispora arenicola]